MILALFLLSLGIAAYSVSQLQQHGQLRWMKNTIPFDGFWGPESHKRKYKMIVGQRTKEPAFFLSTTLLVFLTDGYHFMQFWMFNFLATAFTFALGWNWYLFAGLMIGIRILHWLCRKLLSK